MDEGDRPEGEGDPAERDEVIDGNGDERDGTESTDSADIFGSATTSEPTYTSEPTTRSELTDESEPTDELEPNDEPSDTTETVGPTERGGFRSDDNRESERSRRTRGPSESTESLAHRFRHDREGALMWIREMLSSVAIVLVIGLILFGISGVWPPMVAVESGSMEPNMEVGDLVFVTEPGRLAPDAADNDVGVVTSEEGRAADYRTFGSYGSVVIYRPPGRTASPIIHRAMFHVREGENWYDRADDEYHGAASCAELRHCPAPHDGFITLGDNNGAYDQANGLAPPVRAEWVTGVARVRVPYLGYVRLIASGQAEPGDVLATTAAAEPEAVGELEAAGASETDADDALPGPAVGSGGGGSPTVSGGGSIASAAA